ncbi:PIG-L deacetylase family protein [Corynebacterium mayonis]|uniref:PIG-L deacetylase family protein n=1 Tax=Corynebacterium mayonis TaxID=3062461 RepID=UPI00313FE23A
MQPIELTAQDRVLAVVAHPDDMEYGASAAVAKWVDDGVEVHYLLLTHGEHGIAGAKPEDTAHTRAQEQREACRQVGVSELNILDFPDGNLVYGLEMRKAIAREIRKVKPTVVLTQNFDVVAPWGLNQADHRATGLAAVDAARDAGNEFVFPDAGERHQAKLLLIANPSEPDRGVIIERKHVDQGIASLESHKLYLEALPDHPSGEDLVGGNARAGGEAMGTDYAIMFKGYDL